MTGAPGPGQYQSKIHGNKAQAPSWTYVIIYINISPKAHVCYSNYYLHIIYIYILLLWKSQA